VKLRNKVNAESADVFEEIIAQKVVAIDVGNSEFADVLLPVTLKTGSTIVGFQCKQYARLVSI